jgi:hypothetical protein
MSASVQAPGSAPAGRKVALVVGNSNYSDGQVSGVKDAEAMAEALGQIGFNVLPIVTDKNLDDTRTALTNFQQEIKDASVVVFFYSGHGFQSSGQNYLMPIGGSVELTSCVSLNEVVQGLVWAPNASKIVFLDACRTEKGLPDGALQGLATAPPAPRKVLQAFAASPGQVAASGSGDGLSPYTTALLPHLLEPGLTLGEFFAKVHSDLVRARQVPTEFNNGVASDLSLCDPVFLAADIPSDVKNLFVILNGEVVLDSSKPSGDPIQLQAGTNNLLLMVSNGRTHRNGHDWDIAEGWSYKVTLGVAGQGEWTFEDGEDIPFENGPHHGGVFTVARANLVVAPAGATVSLEDRKDKVWDLEAPFWARDQDLLYEVSVKDLPLKKLLDPQRLPDFGVIPAATASVLLQELLTTGKFLNQQIADPANTFFTVRGNTAFKDLVRVCVKDQEDDRVNDFFSSIKAALNRQRTPFDTFINGLNLSLQKLATADPTLPAEAKADARVWTAIEDRSAPPQPAVAPAGARMASPLAPKAVRAASRTVLASAARAEAVVAPDPLFQKQADEIFSVAVPFNQTVQGVPLTAQAYAFFSIRSIDGSIRVNVRVVADLSDLQSKIGALVDLIPLPTNQCAEFGTVNNVVRIWGKTITIDSDVATLKLQGDVDGYFCVKGAPCSKLVWNGPFPDLVFFDCNPPVTTHVFNQPFDATIPFGLGVADRLTLELNLGQPSVTLGGQLGGVTNGILQIAGVNLNDQLKTALDGIVNPGLLKGALPADLTQLDPVVTKAVLFSNAGALAASVELNVPFDIRIFKALADAFAKLGS